MGIKLNRNGRMIVVAIGVLMVSFAVLFQNCSPTTLTTDADAMYSDSTTGGDSSYRLPAGFNETLNTGITCNVAINSPTIAVGATLSYTFTNTGTLPVGYRIYAYGTKNNVPDASEVSPQFFSTLTQSFVNPGFLGGNYTRFFQIRDSAGRVLCQTNTVAIGLAGNQCTLSTPTPTLRQGFSMVLNTAYAAGTTVPTNGTLVLWNGSTNGFPIAPIPYGQTNFLQYVGTITAADVGNEYIRMVTVLNPDGTSIYCQTNSVRITVLR